jgi:predicted permease
MRFWKRAETELDREIAHHLHHLAGEYQRQGHSPREAMLMARRDFGGAELYREQCRDERRFAWLAGLRQDLAFGLRMMRGAPAVTIAAVLSLALGIGANAAIASLMDVILWRSLPVANPQQLRLVRWEANGFPRDLADGGSGSMYREPAEGVDVADFFAYPAFEGMKKGVADRASVAAYNGTMPVSVSYEGRSTVAEERPVSGNFFATIQTRPAIGRLLVEDDDRSASPAVVVVSHRFWSNTLGSNPNAVGKTLIVNNRAHVIVGVLAPEFFGLNPGDATGIYAAIHHAASRAGWNPTDWLLKDRSWGTQVIARLRVGVEPGQARAQMDAIFRSTWTRAPKDMAKAPKVRLVDGARGLGDLTREFRNPLYVLAALVSLLLVIACANIANLLLARAVARRKEIAMRVSLGCSRGRLMRQFLIESALLALAGGAASIAVAYATGNLLGQFVGGRDSVPISVPIDYRILSLVGAITVVALAVFGVFPAWQGARRLDFSWLKQGGGSIGDGRRSKWNTGRTLVVAQMAMSVVLVMAAVIFTRNLRTIQKADPGFERRNLVLFGVRPGTSGYEAARLPQFYFDLSQRLASTPGVASAGLTQMRPMNVGGWWDTVRLDGQTESNNVSLNGVTPSYLPLFAPHLAAGRNITWADIQGDVKVAVISEDLARKLGGSNVLGRTLRIVGGPPGEPSPGYEIVGITPAFAATSMKDRPFTMWLPFQKDRSEATVVVRTTQAPQAVLPAIRQTIADMDRNLPLVDVVTMEEQIDKILQRERMFATLCGGFGILAIALSVVGLYGVMAYNTSRRRSEIGLRLALGALPRNVVSMVMWEGMTLALVGIALGVPVMWLGAKYAEKELFHMKVFEPASILAALGILVAAALVAVGAPAARASALQPSETLREQ